MPSAQALARRKRRRRWRALGMTVFTLLTVSALVAVGRIVYVLAKNPPKTVALALDSAPTGAGVADAAAARSSLPSAKPQVKPQVSDRASGLSYDLLGKPWRLGCPAALNSGMFDWQAGEGAVAGTYSGQGSPVTWYGNACSGLLPQQVPFTGLEQAATALADAIYPQYYDPLPHRTTVLLSTEMLVGAHDAWEISFSESYATPGLAWSAELGAVIVVDRGIGQTPAVFFVSVPDDLGTADMVTTLVSSLRLP